MIKVGEFLKTLEYDYPAFHLSMDCFRATVESGELVLKEAESAKWLALDELDGGERSRSGSGGAVRGSGSGGCSGCSGVCATCSAQCGMNEEVSSK